MKRGYTKAWRKELESDIWIMPPVYHRVWYWIRQKVQHETYLFPTRRLYGIWVLPGQKVTSLQEIADGVKWRDNNREITPDKRTIGRVLEWLEFHRCISVASDHFGTIINVINWECYNGANEGLATDDVYKKRMLKNKEEEVKEKVVLPKTKRPRTQKISDEEWLAQIKVNPAYEGIDIDKLHGKCQAWCMTKGKQMTRARLLNWLNREDKPMDLLTSTPSQHDKPVYVEPEMSAKLQALKEQYGND